MVVGLGYLQPGVVQALEEQLQGYQVLASSKKVHLAERRQWVGCHPEG